MVGAASVRSFKASIIRATPLEKPPPISACAEGRPTLNFWVELVHPVVAERLPPIDLGSANDSRNADDEEGRS